MQTDELAHLLATGLEPTPPGAARRRWTFALTSSATTAAALMLLWLGLEPALPRVATLPMFWVKLGLPLALCAGALLAVIRLARPGAALGAAPWFAAVPVLLIWALAAVVLQRAAPEARSALLFGQTWQVCPLYITSLAAPTFLAAWWALRGLAPTRLRSTGAAAGLLAGAVGALVYTFHCPELAAPFIAVWYVLGMCLPAVLGAVLGPSLLRW